MHSWWGRLVNQICCKSRKRCTKETPPLNLTATPSLPPRYLLHPTRMQFWSIHTSFDILCVWEFRPGCNIAPHVQNFTHVCDALNSSLSLNSSLAQLKWLLCDGDEIWQTCYAAAPEAGDLVFKANGEAAVLMNCCTLISVINIDNRFPIRTSAPGLITNTMSSGDSIFISITNRQRQTWPSAARKRGRVKCRVKIFWKVWPQSRANVSHGVWSHFICLLMSPKC